MKHFFGTKDVAYAAKIGGSTIADYKEINSLADGAVAFFTPAGVLIPATGTAGVIAGTSEFYMAVGSGSTTTGAKVSMMIKRAAKQYTKTGYVAAVKQKSFVGNDGSSGSLNLPGTLVNGEVLEVVVVDTSAPVNNTIEAKKYRYEYTIKSGDTATSIITSLIAKINADANAFVVATVVGSQVGFSLEATSYGKTFAVGVSGVLADAKVWNPGTGNAVAFHPGFGTVASVQAIELECAPHEGKTNALELADKYYSVPSMVDTTEVYDVYDIKWNVSNTPPAGVGGSVATQQHLVLALVDGGTPQANVDTILDLLITVS